MSTIITNTRGAGRLVGKQVELEIIGITPGINYFFASFLTLKCISAMICTIVYSIVPDNNNYAKEYSEVIRITGKWWGDTNEQPILAIHGQQDNASTFDALLELLPFSKPVFSVDTPGHGFSSHFPPAMLYQSANYIMTFRRIQKYFKWNQKMTIIGHSEGGVTAFLFSAIYPECVNALITLDVIKPFVPESNFFQTLGAKIDNCVEKSGRGPGGSPKYTLEEIEERWVKGTRGSLSPNAVKVLMKRGVLLDNQSGKYSFTRDPKLKIRYLHFYSEEESLALAKNLKCHYLAIKFRKGEFFDLSLKNSPNFISTLNEVTKSFKTVTVEGTHHGHLTNPENIVPVIMEFLTHTKSI